MLATWVLDQNSIKAQNGSFNAADARFSLYAAQVLENHQSDLASLGGKALNRLSDALERYQEYRDTFGFADDIADVQEEIDNLNDLIDEIAATVAEILSNPEVDVSAGAVIEIVVIVILL
jgi:uncharacterized protein YicC (UPF0701 family)